jgi:hypothetical protein
MNNTFIINNLKQKNSFNRQKFSQTNTNNQLTNTNNQLTNTNNQENRSNTILSETETNSNSNSKFNPDVEQNFSNAKTKRDAKDFQYSTNIWKPIIGGINKDKIKAEDLQINMEKPDHIKIKSNYEIQLEERENEKLIAEKLAQEYARVNGLNKLIEIKQDELKNMSEIKQDELKNMSEIDNTFIELKSSAQDIFKDTNNLDINTIMESMSILDDLMNSVKNL